MQVSFGNMELDFGNTKGQVAKRRWQRRPSRMLKPPKCKLVVGAAVFFLYSPFPYWAVMVLATYRHDLSMLFHPARDNGSLRNWWYVLDHLGLLSPEKPSKPGMRSELLPYVPYVVGSAAVSLSWTFRLFPLAWYTCVLVQATAGMILTAGTVRYLGQPPRRPYVDVLRYPRLGSRVRHLPKISSLQGKENPSRRQAVQVAARPLTAAEGEKA